MNNLLSRVARLLRIDDPDYPMSRTVIYDLLEVPSSDCYPPDTQRFHHDISEITLPTGDCLVLVDRSSGDDHAYLSRSSNGVAVLTRADYEAIKAKHMQHMTGHFNEERHSFVFERNAMEVIVADSVATLQVHENGHTVTFPSFLKVGQRIA